MAGTTRSARPRPYIRAVLIDISGNLHVGSNPTANAVDALQQLRASSIPFRLCSNTSKESTSSLIDKLNKMGFGIPAQPISANFVGAGAADQNNKRIRREVWTSIGAVSQVLSNLGLKRPFTILSKSAREEVASAIQVPEDNRPSILNSSTASQPSATGSFHIDQANVATTNNDQREYDSVIVGLAPSALNYENLNTAFRVLIGEHPRKDHPQPGSNAFSRPAPGSASGDPSLGVAGGTRGALDAANTQQDKAPRALATPKARLIATHKAKYLESDSPPGLSLGPGPFVSALEIAAGVEAHVVGKPTRAFFEAVIGDFMEDELRGEGVYGGLVNDRRSRTTSVNAANRMETEDGLEEAQDDDGYHDTAARTAATSGLTTHAGVVRGNKTGNEALKDRGRIAVIGDDVEADLGEGAVELGLWRVLVRTGKYRPGDESREGVVPPNEVVNTFADFVESLLESNGLAYADDKDGDISSGELGKREE